MANKWFQGFKYSVYLFLFANVFLFLRKEWIAAIHRFPDGYGFSQLIEVFPSTIDTAAWFILLMVFELETFLLDDNVLKKQRTQWIFSFLKGLSYLAVLYSLWGYISSYTWLHNFEKIDPIVVCEIQGQSWMKDTDSFKKIDGTNCQKLAKGDSFLKYTQKEIYTDNITFRKADMLAIAGVINSLTWIFVLIVLEIDVWLQLKNRLKGRLFKFSNIIKNILYTILIIVAIYWGITGKFLDFWDAFMWIVAFFFIELNLLQWKKDTEEESTSINNI